MGAMKTGNSVALCGSRESRRIFAGAAAVVLERRALSERLSVLDDEVLRAPHRGFGPPGPALRVPAREDADAR